jgi:hypothetical protein
MGNIQPYSSASVMPTLATKWMRGMPPKRPKTQNSKDRQGRILGVFMTGMYMDTAHPMASAAGQVNGCTICFCRALPS